MKNGGPAFPIYKDLTKKYELHEGMSLKDYFACHEEGQMVSYDKLAEKIGIEPFKATPGTSYDEWLYQHYPRMIAHWKYRCADAMITEREKRNSNE